MKKLFTFITAIIASGSLNAQIPNNGFETWTTTGGYDVPTGWDQLNSTTAPFSVYTCEKGTPGAPGASYLQLTSKTVTGLGVVPGIAVSGVIDVATHSAKSGFPYTGRPASLTGNWQYMAFGADKGHIAVLLTKWNTTLIKRDTVSLTDYALPGMIMIWTPFTIPLTYTMGANPDSAIILLSASGGTPVNNSFLYVDSLGFTGVATGVTNVSAASSFTSLFPNPATGTTNIVYNAPAEGKIEVYINDMSGRSVMSLSPKTVVGVNKIPISVADLAKGIYVVRVVDGQNSEVQKLIVE